MNPSDSDTCLRCSAAHSHVVVNDEERNIPQDVTTEIEEQVVGKCNGGSPVYGHQGNPREPRAHPDNSRGSEQRSSNRENPKSSKQTIQKMTVKPKDRKGPESHSMKLETKLKKVGRGVASSRSEEQ